MGAYLEHNTELARCDKFYESTTLHPPPGHSSLDITPPPRQFSPPPSPPPRHFPSRYLVRYDIYYIPYFYVINVYYIITYINSCYHMRTISEMGVGSCRGGGGGDCPGGTVGGGGECRDTQFYLLITQKVFFIPAMVAHETRTSVCPPRRRACLLIIFDQKKYSFKLARIRTHDLLVPRDEY